jgi:hypothetical protein
MSHRRTPLFWPLPLAVGCSAHCLPSPLCRLWSTTVPRRCFPSRRSHHPDTTHLSVRVWAILLPGRCTEGQAAAPRAVSAPGCMDAAQWADPVPFRLCPGQAVLSQWPRRAGRLTMLMGRAHWFSPLARGKINFSFLFLFSLNFENSCLFEYLSKIHETSFIILINSRYIQEKYKTYQEALN